MVITYLGGSFFKIQFGDMIIAVNPVSKDSKKFKPSKFGADLCLISANHADMNGKDQVSFGGKEAFVVSGPGEYERKGIFVRGIESKSKYGDEEKINTIYTFNVDSMNLCFLGALSAKDIPADAMEQLDDIDMLFVPVGTGLLSPKDAYSLAVSLEPKVIVPVVFGDAKVLESFIKETGEKGVAAQDKLTIKKKDLEGKEDDIMVIKESA